MAQVIFDAIKFYRMNYERILEIIFIDEPSNYLKRIADAVIKQLDEIPTKISFNSISYGLPFQKADIEIFEPKVLTLSMLSYGFYIWLATDCCNFCILY
ncbi:hypothetical protein PVAND_016395 [Polypedilum vanderplanki]|uniref:Uncharacterized protein n=1 Tax=Polypedilum vanderplanki TaxID=319348 RepID=A0A9J6BFT1_POLVA|nr:hypothetical protein PVAND_016395 [Polypedilum vanderplanki]